jgi:hypothetical protein
MRILVTISLSYIAEAYPDASQICMSACGLIHDSDATQCKDASANGIYCNQLQKVAGFIQHQFGNIDATKRVTVADAATLVMADANNCFAMYYEKEPMRLKSQYCSNDNVCKGLYWDKRPPDGAGSDYLFAEEGTSTANILSPVLCDYQTAEKKYIEEDHRGKMDPCKAVCGLTHSADECKLVLRQGNSCVRLFWSDSNKQETHFSVRVAAGSEIQVTVAEADELLMAENNDCLKICKDNPKCKLQDSFCSDNGTCKSLFYEGTPVRADLKVCYEPDCSKQATPVLCRVDDAKRLDAARAGADDTGAETVTKSSGNGVSLVDAIIAIGVSALVAML